MSADAPTSSPAETEPALPKVARVPLDKLVLDPNNPRIMGRVKPWPVPRERWADVGVQKEVTRALRGPNGRELEDLINNLRMFGWLDVAPIRVQALGDGYFLVLDGNRRVEALRECIAQSRDAVLTVQQSLLPLRDGLFCLQVPVISDLAQKLTRAHAHLSGSGAWSTYQRAMVMLAIWRDAPWGSVLAAEALNIPKAEFEQMVSAAALCEQYQISEHGAGFEEALFNVFLQTFASDRIPRWIEWSATTRTARNLHNTERLFRWLSTYSGLSQDARARVAGLPSLAGLEAGMAHRPTAPPPRIEGLSPPFVMDVEPDLTLESLSPKSTRGSSSAKATIDHVLPPSARDTSDQAAPPTQRGTDPAQPRPNATQRIASERPLAPERGAGLEPAGSMNLVSDKPPHRPLASSTSQPLVAHNDSPETLGALEGLIPIPALLAALHAISASLPPIVTPDIISDNSTKYFSDLDQLSRSLIDSPYIQGLTQLNEELARSGLLDRIADSLPLNNRVEAKTQHPPSWRPRFEGDKAHLSTLTVAQYRSITGLTLEGLGRINLIVGENNSGKTSVLEAISLLMHQSDPGEVLAALRRRARWDITRDAEWTSQELPAPVQVTAHLSGTPSRESSVTLTRSTEPPESAEDRVMFLCSLANESRAGEHIQRSTIDIWAGREPKMQVHGERFWLGPTVFHSPFSSSDPETLQRANERAIRLGVKDRLMQFLREEIDGDLRSIELVRDHRFRVSHNKRADSPDLSSFGDGLQRAFQIGLHLAAAAGGVLLIDELENALHTNLLIPFTRLIQELAVEFNVQVFISTHSKETVDAFLFNDYRNEDIVAYGLPAKGSEQPVKRYGGPGLRDVVEGLDLDIRRV